MIDDINKEWMSKSKSSYDPEFKDIELITYFRGRFQFIFFFKLKSNYMYTGNYYFFVRQSIEEVNKLAQDLRSSLLEKDTEVFWLEPVRVSTDDKSCDFDIKSLPLEQYLEENRVQVNSWIQSWEFERISDSADMLPFVPLVVSQNVKPSRVMVVYTPGENAGSTAK
mmetsp:Transcript_3354/g.5071  ORF Transcript_3354/g.5071 Transcript_3354/m.5071 type:complete len:167 (-) Transcript_3354:504-1004(-)